PRRPAQVHHHGSTEWTNTPADPGSAEKSRAAIDRAGKHALGGAGGADGSGTLHHLASAGAADAPERRAGNQLQRQHQDRADHRDRPRSEERRVGKKRRGRKQTYNVTAGATPDG